MTKKIKQMLMVFFLLTIPQTVVAHAGEQSLLSKFQGEWISDGEAFGQTATSTMVWSQALNKKFMHLEYKITMGSEGKSSVFQGTAYYKSLGNDEYSAFWADNIGDLHPITAKIDGNALVSIWGVKGAKLGRTRYELQGPNLLSVTDWIKKGDDWRQFNHNIFSRVKTR